MLGMAIPADRIHHEDVEVGRPVTFGRREVTKDEIVRFAQAFDPQPMHLDEEAAKKSIVGGLCASGFHSCALLMRIYAEDFLNHSTSLGSPGVDEVRWMKPVRPGDILSARLVCIEKRALGSKPEVGLAKAKIEMLNQKGETVMTWEANQLLRVRDPRPADPAAAKGAAPAPLGNLWEMTGPAPNLESNYFEDRQVG